MRLVSTSLDGLNMKTELKSIEEEKQDCIEAFKANPDTKFAWCCHHDVLIEALIEPWLNRVNYISSDKPKAEQASRFRSFRPVRVALTYQVVKAMAECVKALAERDKAWYVYDKVVTEYHSELTLLHNQDWPDNTWNGKQVEGT